MSIHGDRHDRRIRERGEKLESLPCGDLAQARVPPQRVRRFGQPQVGAINSSARSAFAASLSGSGMTHFSAMDASMTILTSRHDPAG